MPRRSSFLAVGPACLLAGAVLAASVLAGEPIYDRKAGHPWDEAREIFYTHRFPTGEIYEHPHAFAPPWKEWVPFVHDAAFHAQVLARLEAVEKLPPAQMEQQSAARRLIFLRDLWRCSTGSTRRWSKCRATTRPPRTPSSAAMNCCVAWPAS